MPLHTALRVVSGLALFLDACDTVLNLDGVFSFRVYFWLKKYKFSIIVA